MSNPPVNHGPTPAHFEPLSDPRIEVARQQHARIAHLLGMDRKEPWAVLERALKQRLEGKPDESQPIPRVLVAERELGEVRQVLEDGFQHLDTEGRPLSVVALARRRLADLREVGLTAEAAVAERDGMWGRVEAAERKADTWQQTAAAMETRALKAEEQEKRADEVLAVQRATILPYLNQALAYLVQLADSLGDNDLRLIEASSNIQLAVNSLGSRERIGRPVTATQTIRAWSTDPVQRVPPPLAEPPAARFTLLDGSFLGHQWKGHEVLMDGRTGKPLAVGNHPAFLSGDREALGDATPVSLLSLQGLLGLLNELMATEGK